MNVVRFPRADKSSVQGWQTSELTKLTNSCAASIPAGGISGWEVGFTDYGDPQLYLLGPAPDHDCILSISRLGRLYVLEDGKGQVLFENDNIMLLADHACSRLRRKKTELVARLTVCWCAIREFFEEKVEPVVAEPMEIMTHFAPHLAALA
jgi:hypothetical protein